MERVNGPTSLFLALFFLVLVVGGIVAIRLGWRKDSSRPAAQALPNEVDESAYPSVQYAYEFVSASYDWALRRQEANETRLQSLQTYAATIAFSVPIAAKAVSNMPDFSSSWFWAGIGAFASIVIIATLVRLLLGSITLIGMESLFKDWLYLSEWKFKMEMIGLAGAHQNTNLFKINLRGWIADGLTVLLALEVGFFLIWLRHGL